MNRSHRRFVPHNRPVQPVRRMNTDRSARSSAASRSAVPQRANRPAVMSRPSYQQRTNRSAAVSRPTCQQRTNRSAVVSRPPYLQRLSHAAMKERNTRRSYWFPIATMMAALLFAVSAVIPGSIFDAFASSDDSYTFGIESQAGAYTVTLTGGKSTSIDLPAENADKTVNSDGTVTFAIDLDEETNYTIESPVAMQTISFDNAVSAEPAHEAAVVVSGDGDEEGEDEAEESSPKAGVEAVTSIDLSQSGATSLDISKCAGIKNVSLAGNAALSGNASTSITYGSQTDTTVTLDTPDFEYVDRGEQGKGYLLTVTGAGEFEYLTATLYGDIPVAKENGKFFISFDNLDATFSAGDNHGAPASEIIITNSTQPGVNYRIFFDAGNVSQYMDPDTNPVGDDTTSSDNTGETGDTNDTGNTGDDSGDENSPNVKLTVDTGSKSIIKEAYVENVSSIKPSELKIVAKTLSAANKKTFLAAVKKEDKDFNDSDANLLVYDIYVADSKGNKVDLKDKAAVTVTLAYPSYEVEYLKDEYEFKVYHQLVDKSIDTSIDAYSTKDGIQFTTDSFSNFAVSSTKKKQEYFTIVVDNDSKAFASAARGHEGTVIAYEDETAFDGDEIRLVVQKPSDAAKKEFLDAIKKADKNFSSTDKNLLVYEVHLKSDLGEDLHLQEGKVDFTLVYPNDTVKKNYTKYNFTVYHQLTDKSIDTKQLAVGGKDGITVTTDGFSLFAVSSTPKPSGSDNPKTGESNVAANIAMLLAALSMVSFAGVYAKNKAEQY